MNAIQNVTQVAAGNTRDLNNLFIQGQIGPVGASLMTGDELNAALANFPNDSLIVETSCLKNPDGTPSGNYQNHMGVLHRNADGTSTIKYKSAYQNINPEHLFLSRLSGNEFSWPLPDTNRYYIRVMSKVDWMTLVLAYAYSQQTAQFPQQQQPPQANPLGYGPPMPMPYGHPMVQVPPSSAKTVVYRQQRQHARILRRYERQ